MKGKGRRETGKEFKETKMDMRSCCCTVKKAFRGSGGGRELARVYLEDEAFVLVRGALATVAATATLDPGIVLESRYIQEKKTTHVGPVYPGDCPVSLVLPLEIIHNPQPGADQIHGEPSLGAIPHTVAVSGRAIGHVGSGFCLGKGEVVD